jgi:hypothetical protein
MKKLGYGKHYSYDPNYAHPVFNVSEAKWLLLVTG